jgi:hypothetical protein
VWRSMGTNRRLPPAEERVALSLRPGSAITLRGGQPAHGLHHHIHGAEGGQQHRREPGPGGRRRRGRGRRCRQRRGDGGGLLRGGGAGGRRQGHVRPLHRCQRRHAVGLAGLLGRSRRRDCREQLALLRSSAPGGGRGGGGRGGRGGRQLQQPPCDRARDGGRQPRAHAHARPREAPLGGQHLRHATKLRRGLARAAQPRGDGPHLPKGRGVQILLLDVVLRTHTGALPVSHANGMSPSGCGTPQRRTSSCSSSPCHSRISALQSASLRGLCAA